MGFIITVGNIDPKRIDEIVRARNYGEGIKDADPGSGQMIADCLVPGFRWNEEKSSFLLNKEEFLRDRYAKFKDSAARVAEMSYEDYVSFRWKEQRIVSQLSEAYDGGIIGWFVNEAYEFMSAIEFARRCNDENKEFYVHIYEILDF